MYCPRCGSPNTETTKYCRQCGLALNQVAGYVATGGTSQLSPAGSSSKLAKFTEGMTPTQLLVMKILFFAFLPAILAIIGGNIPIIERLIPLAGILVLPGIIWSIFTYRNQKARLAQQQAQSFHEAVSFQNQGQQASLPPQAYQPPVQSPPTNPLKDKVPHSVTEDETRRFQ